MGDVVWVKRGRGLGWVESKCDESYEVHEFKSK